MNKFDSQISVQELDFEIKGKAASFEISLINLSGQFASFRVDIVAGGSDPNLGNNWYKLSQEVSAKIPNGDSTKFLVNIIDTPIPGMDIVNITVTISSLEFPDFQRHNLRVRVKESSSPILLQLYLNSQNIIAYPRQIIEIPVRVYNPSQKTVDIILKFLELETNWLNQGNERKILIGGGKQEQISFSCHPPVAIKAQSKKYPFKIAAYLHNKIVGSVDGFLEILPIGTILFNVKNSQKSLPQKAYWLPKWDAKKAVYELEFKNISNLFQTVNINLKGTRNQKYNYQLTPEQVELSPGTTQQVNLEITKKRPWWGLNRKISLTVDSLLSDERLGKTDPPSQILELIIYPLLPLWLQILTILLTLVLIIALLPNPQHTDRVNSVAFSGVVNPVFSGSSDQKIIEWRVNQNNFLCQAFQWQRFCLNYQKTLPISNNKGVNIVKISPENNNQIAIGLENGEIFVYNYRTEQTLKLEYENYDTVLSLIFTKNSQYLLSGHGNSFRQWNLPKITASNQIKEPEFEEKNLGSTVQALAFSKDEKSLVVAGNYNKIWIGTWMGKIPNFDETRRLTAYPSGTKEDYIRSLASLDNYLVTGDTRGDIRLWNLADCAEKPNRCEPLFTWSITYPNGDPMPIYSLALTKSKNNYYLAGAGNDGIIRLWSWSLDSSQSPLATTPLKEYQTFTRINSVDLIFQTPYLLILSGGDDSKVRLNLYYDKNL